MTSTEAREDLCSADELARTMRTGNIEALDRLTLCFGEKLLAAGRRYCGDEQRARDAVQDTMLAAGTRLADFRGEGSVEGWLVRMVANFCRRMQRGQKNDPAIHQDVAEVEPRDRTLLLLSDAEGWKAPEIAEALDMTPGNVRTRLSRARKRLREHLGTLGEHIDIE
jgi:RNA polymerase sigma-70 factor (ECF subfamily)